MSDNMSTHLEELRKQQSIIKDRIRGVVHNEANGMYLHGRPGSSKTFMVRTTLDVLAVPHTYSNGHVTPIGLFQLIENNRNGIIVLDDVSSLFSQPIALQLLLAALGNSHDGSRVRLVRHKTAKGDVVVPFTGGIMAISNLPLAGHNREVLSALNDRVYVIGYEPTDQQIEAQIMEIASTGPRDVPADKAQQVAHFLLTECKRIDMRPSIRLFVDKALVDYRLWDAERTESHWKDLVISSLKQETFVPEREQRDLSRTERTDAERRIALGVYLDFEGREERVEAWKERTGKSQAAFYRRLDELRKANQLPSIESTAAPAFDCAEEECEEPVSEPPEEPW